MKTGWDIITQTRLFDGSKCERKACKAPGSTQWCVLPYSALMWRIWLFCCFKSFILPFVLLESVTVKESSPVMVQLQRAKGLTALQLIKLLIEELVTSGPQSKGKGPAYYTGNKHTHSHKGGLTNTEICWILSDPSPSPQSCFPRPPRPPQYKRPRWGLATGDECTLKGIFQ